MKISIKKFFALLLSAASVACAGAGVSACSSNGGNGGSVAGKWDEYDGVKVAFLDEAGYNDGEIDENKASPELNCNTGEKYYMVVDFDIVAPYDNDGRESVTASVQIKPAAALRATIQDTNSGNVSEETKDDITELKATYKIPEKADSPRNMRLVIQVNSLCGSEAYLNIAFDSNGEMQAVHTKEIKKTACIDYTKELEYSFIDGGGKSGYWVKGVKDTSLKEIVIPYMISGEYVTTVKTNFNKCSRLKKLKIPSSVTSIMKGALLGCDSLESLTVPFVGGGVDPTWGNSLGRNFEYIFGDSGSVPMSLKSVVISGGGAIGADAFWGCKGIADIRLEEGVSWIGLNSFRGCAGLKTISIPNSVTGIGDKAFWECGELSSIILPSTITYIGSSAFYCCGNLKSFVYKGTKEQWEGIEKGGYWNSGTYFTIHCTDGDLTK